jgi:hypothetical protein
MERVYTVFALAAVMFECGSVRLVTQNTHFVLSQVYARTPRRYER